MNQTFFLAIATIILLTTSCSECGECTTPPAPFTFELLDAEVRESLFINETYATDELSIRHTGTNRTVDYEVLMQNDRILIQTNEIGWQTETVDLEFVIDQQTLFSFYVDAENVTEDCCNFTRYKETTLSGAEFEVEEMTGFYQVYIN